ncbi:DUF6950 family protein [Seohaeicola zhoushanensis]|uniref:DUF6950 domain-containing protein n=1 Tax=Seohaeicola zhoushanensis TaxID=1569283 RepID=A0A8J3H180_9RHOB|nr:hypothetical protein [Seohaeicola zhoushanensis]GHF71218.1 hypothetical protein GCM10017056_47670 [Seohaeicola zhoushanensis]
MTPLYRELHRWASTPFIWGETDCMTCLADWVLRVRGVDPAAEIRGTYDSRGSCQRETGFFRDPVAAIERCLATIGGLPRVEGPQAGDVAVILAPVADGRLSPCGAIWLGSAWGCKGPSGTTTLNPRFIDVARDADGVPGIWGVGYAA